MQGVRDLSKKIARSILKRNYGDRQMFAYLEDVRAHCDKYPNECEDEKNPCSEKYMRYDKIWRMDVPHCPARYEAARAAIDRVAEIIERGMQEAANRSVPEPMTSVVRWVRYDGTPETLPEIGRIVFISSGGSGVIPVTTIYNGDSWEINMTTPADTKPFYLTKKPMVGDVWAYLPEPPKGTE